ncbi:mediator of RNA polymerase II transcription subunit 33A isoform X2 [Cryptomeria japonica]|uniref:mediator of RNA polymerase II transcription subunit 33A isoform X2 n=1 Tax=Cryptomeria japonica TaxID=3369 RepID=UPI0027DAA8E6|nr:mediator of RNA polymerase II transcription subunit 33A isoform X2 [Cryptomeria japonica]
MVSEEEGWVWQQQVVEVTRVCQEQRDTPLLWAVEVSKCLRGAAVSMPSVELGHLLISHLCWSNNGPILWKYIDQAMSSSMTPSLLILALLTSRVIPYRQIQPEAYRLYLELLGRYSFSLALTNTTSTSKKIVEAVDDALQLSKTYGIPVTELGKAAVLFTLTVVSTLVNAVAEDSGLQGRWLEKQYRLGGNVGQHDMVKGADEDVNEKRHQHREHLRRTNIVMAIEMVRKLMEHKKTSTFFRLACRNMTEQWSGLCQRLQVLEAHSSSLSLKIDGGLFTQLVGSIQRSLSLDYQPSQHQAIRALIDSGSRTSAFGHRYGVGRASTWLPFDLFMEDTMDGRQVSAKSTIESLTELTKSLQAVHGASWQEAFLGLWTAALRLVQRERDPIEGPIPHLDSRLCILLCITPLVIVSIIEEEDRILQAAKNNTLGNVANAYEHDKERKVMGLGTRHAALVSSLQILGQFDELLKPPESVVLAANKAALKAESLVSTGSFDGLSSNVGNMRHLIVEACIARKLLDSSAYLWPGYVERLANPLSHSIPVQEFPWSAFMEGAPLSVSLKDALIKTPASSLEELEKVYHIAMNGSEEERSAMASILCGASLIRGWNVQEHAVRLVVNLLSPPIPVDHHGSGSLLEHAPLLNAVLRAVTTHDNVHVLSLYGVVPQVAAALMPICETFGSILPTSPQISSTGEEVSVYTIFSNAFLLLLRLWKFYGCAHAHGLSGMGAPVGTELALEYLLLLHNSRLTKDNEHYQVKESLYLDSALSQVPIPPEDQALGVTSSFSKPLFIDSFPKLKVWYCQHQACIASTLSGLVPGNPVHQIADRLLNMMYWKLGKGVPPTTTSVASGSSSLSSSSGSAGGETSRKPLLTAWEILGAVPFVVDAVLTACAHGKISPRDLTTGLRDLVDFLPASIATIGSYFSAEVTRGVWKPASMNGTDWPSPAANLLSIEAVIKEILADTGVHVPSLVIGGNTPATLPLPLAALVSLTITFKLDKHSELMTGIAGSVLETTAAGSPWPCMPIVAALWCQKVRRWHDFIVFYSSCTVFMHDKHAVVQLLKSCFSATLGSTNNLMSKLTVHGGIGALLGHGYSSNSSPCGTAPAAPGVLYLRTYHSMYDIKFLAEEILSLVAGVVRDFVTMGMNHQHSGQSLGAPQRLKSENVSLENALERSKQASSLGASLLCISGGSELVQMLYKETLPTWFLSEKTKTKSASSVSTLEGYTIAQFSFLCGACTWGVDISPSSKKRAQIVGTHMDFLASAIDGNMSMGCEHPTWRAYVLGFLTMVINCSPNWICEVNIEILKRLATRLKWWHEPELALALLERGGPLAVSAAAELVSSY